MTVSGSSDLKSTLGAFVLPQTGRPLSGPGASFDLERRGAGWHATVKLGFPLAASGGALIEALRLHCASALAGASLDVTLVSSIVAHAVQHGLKPLPGTCRT